MPAAVSSSPDYAAAAQRHKRDGDLLFGAPSPRLENADHLYGFAAECALLGGLRILNRAGLYPELALDEKGAVANEDLRRSGHIREVWSHMIGRVFRMKDRGIQTLFQRFSAHRDGSSKEPFRDWSVNDRYRGDGHTNLERVVAHKTGAEACLAVLGLIEQHCLKGAKAPEGTS